VSLTREDMLRELELLPVWRPRMPPVTNASPGLSEPLSVVPAEVEVEKTDALPEVAPAEPVSTPTAVESASQEAIENAEHLSPDIQATWLLLCPQASDASSQELLQNIIRALKLPAEEVLLYQQALQATRAQSRFCVLFGLEAANHFLATSHSDIASVRGRLLKHGDTTYVITHHPHVMLENPLLKKEVWHDLCLLLAEK
jgi:hypothetical protein